MSKAMWKTSIKQVITCAQQAVQDFRLQKKPKKKSFWKPQCCCFCVTVKLLLPLVCLTSSQGKCHYQILTTCQLSAQLQVHPSLSTHIAGMGAGARNLLQYFDCIIYWGGNLLLLPCLESNDDISDFDMHNDLLFFILNSVEELISISLLQHRMKCLANRLCDIAAEIASRLA